MTTSPTGEPKALGTKAGAPKTLPVATKPKLVPPISKLRPMPAESSRGGFFAIDQRTSTSTILMFGLAVGLCSSLLFNSRALALSIDYVIFFGHKQLNPTAEYVAIVETFARRFKAAGASSVIVMGHADNSPEEVQNLGLAAARAEVIKRALIAAGIPPQAIQTGSRYSADPRVPTPKGVAEEQNRRVELRMQ